MNKTPSYIHHYIGDAAKELFGSDSDSSVGGDGDRHHATHQDEDETVAPVEEEEEEETEERVIDAEVPPVEFNLGKQLHFVKMPNFLSVDTRFVFFDVDFFGENTNFF